MISTHDFIMFVDLWQIIPLMSKYCYPQWATIYCIVCLDICIYNNILGSLLAKSGLLMHMVKASKQFKYFEIILKSTLCGTVWYNYLLQILDMHYLSFHHSVHPQNLSTSIQMKMFVYENGYLITCWFMKIIMWLENWQYSDSIIHDIWLLIAR